MLIRAHDAWTDETEWADHVRDVGFGHLAVNGPDGVPVVVPTQFVLADDNRTVHLHLAKANPVFDALAASPRAVLSVARDWAYIPGGWKAIGDEDPTKGIPTTYYSAVQLIGDVDVLDDTDAIADTLRTQLADVEPDGNLQDPSVHAGQFRVIRGLRLSVTEVRAKAKYGGNVDDAHRAAIAERLRGRGGPGDTSAAERVPRD